MCKKYHKNPESIKSWLSREIASPTNSNVMKVLYQSSYDRIRELEAQFAALQQICEKLLAEKQKGLTVKDALAFCAEREALEQ